MQESDLTQQILNACFRVHTAMGPGLLESVYEECVCHALSQSGLSFERQKPIALSFEGHPLESALKLDVLVENKVILHSFTVI